MSRDPQQPAPRGSQRWLQALVNDKPDLLTREVAAAVGLPPGTAVTWLSPRRDDGLAEYSDADFLRRLGVELTQRPLGSFWPGGGPVWDGLGKAAGGDLFLLEAKSHIAEAVTPPCRATSPRSLEMIRAALAETKKAFGSSTEADWAASFYQYANRLAHLHLLRQSNGLPAHLVFVYFLNDLDMGGPTTAAEWQGAVKLLRAFLGVGGEPARHVHDVFVDVRALA
jgi:hypothetical protein